MLWYHGKMTQKNYAKKYTKMILKWHRNDTTKYTLKWWQSDRKRTLKGYYKITPKWDNKYSHTKKITEITHQNETMKWC